MTDDEATDTVLISNGADQYRRRARPRPEWRPACPFQRRSGLCWPGRRRLAWSGAEVCSLLSGSAGQRAVALLPVLSEHCDVPPSGTRNSPSAAVGKAECHIEHPSQAGGRLARRDGCGPQSVRILFCPAWRDALRRAQATGAPFDTM